MEQFAFDREKPDFNVLRRGLGTQHCAIEVELLLPSRSLNRYRIGSLPRRQMESFAVFFDVSTFSTQCHHVIVIYPVALHAFDFATSPLNLLVPWKRA